jgi:DNA polymerase I-like protein with 3'-5' exonuclease and polymerase domains
MPLIVLDFETFYDRTFSLAKMTTEEYIRHEYFETVGVAVKVDDGETQWFSGPDKDTKAFLDQFDWANSVAVAHNAMFDMAILNWHFDIRPKMIADTLSMLRAIDGPDAGNSLAKAAERYGLGKKGDEVINALGKGRLDFTPEELARYGDYCKNDVELTYDLFKVIAPLVPPMEAKLIDQTIRMFSEPVLELDADILTEHLTEVRAKKDKLMAAVEADKSVLMSNPKLAELLTSLKVVPPTKISPTTGKTTWAFGKNDEGFKELLDHPNPKVQAIVSARMGVKSTLEETRTERFISIAKRGTLPVPLRYYGAHTGRFSGEDKINLQNVPRKSALKRAIKAPDGCVLIDCDSSQIEARALAWMAEQDDLVEAFERGEDVYKIMASRIYDVTVEEVTDSQRFVGKSAILGCGYGLGPARFQEQLKAFGVTLPLAECQHIIRTYRQTYPKIVQLWDNAKRALNALHSQRSCQLGREGVLQVDLLGIKLPNGLYLRYKNLRDDGEGGFIYDTKKGRSTIPTRIYGPKLVENFIQALARIAVTEQMLMISRRLRVVLTVHDSVVALAPEAQAGEARAFVEQCMRTRPKWAAGLPLNCESKMGASYGG